MKPQPSKSKPLTPKQLEALKADKEKKTLNRELIIKNGPGNTTNKGQRPV